MKKALMIIAIIAIIIIAGSMVYYYVFYKPGIESAAIKLQEQKLEVEKSSQIKEQVKEYLSEYNAIRQEFIDKISETKLAELKEIRIKLMKLSVPEGYGKYKDAKDSCLTAMNESISDLQDLSYADSNKDSSKILEILDKLKKDIGILKSLSIND
jgi:hypothetical protein